MRVVQIATFDAAARQRCAKCCSRLRQEDGEGEEGNVEARHRDTHLAQSRRWLEEGACVVSR